MNFVIPKKKRAVEKSVIDVSTLEPKATIEDAARDSEKFNTVKNVVLNGVSDRQVHHFVHVEKVQVIKNSFLEYKYDQFKANLRASGQSDAESYEFLLIGFDPEDLTYIADNGYSVGTSFYGDLGSTTRGIFISQSVYLYRYVDLVTPSLLYKDEIMRVMVFRTLRGRSYAVGLGSTELEPTLECCSHVAATDNTPLSRKSRQQLYRQAAVYHYEYNKDMSVSDVPSGVLPYAVVDLRFNISDKNQHSNIPPTIGDESLVFTKLLQWTDAYDIRGVTQLMAHDAWGLIARQREICVKNANDRSEKWKFRYVSHFVWTCSDPKFTSLVNGMRVEQCAAIAYSIDATTYVTFPSGQFSSVLGLPWLQIPSLHVLVIHANPLFYADPSDVNCVIDENIISAKTPLGTAILDGDDASLCRFFDHQGALHFNSDPTVPPPHPQSPAHLSNGGSPYAESPSQNNEGCLRSKPPQVFTEQPPLIGRSVPPPPPGPGTGRNAASFGAIPARKSRIRWAENVVDNENKCGKKLSNDRDEAVKAGLHGRAPPPKNLLLKNPGLPPPSSMPPKQPPAANVDPGSSSAGTKYKDLFKGVFSTIAKGGSVDSDIGNEIVPEPTVIPTTETSKIPSLPKRTGTSKNCIITSLPLPLFGRSSDSNREPSSASSTASAATHQAEDVSTVCDMEIESGSDGTPTPPHTKASPDGVDDAVDFIDDQDEDYDAQFQCFETPTTTTIPTDTESSQPPTLAFSIKKTTSAPALNPPAPLVFGDDVDEDDNESDDQRQKQRCLLTVSAIVYEDDGSLVIARIEMIESRDGTNQLVFPRFFSMFLSLSAKNLLIFFLGVSPSG
ncbi:hypothetical protein ANCDUO_04641 [Ancylostoma duodenale]|uniref:TASOR pseudo-PARP domain-containing protein n=1 Tax=Ancylostoma duodenale TaxID=51022 RepID=A0A0C2H0I9_9BILA|nr:hypothetical protein ANCDUO_04641 [Ancylostoma duodenale]